MAHRSGEVHRILSFAIESTDSEDRAKLQQQLESLTRENPILRVEVSAFDEGLVVSGEDELQLIEIRGNILAKHEARIGELQISYKETIRRSAEAEGKYIRRTGPSGNYGHCKLHIDPNEPGKGYEFVNAIESGSVPQEYIKPIEQGVESAIEAGILAGYPLVDIKVILFEGSYHEVDSNEMAFKIAGLIAFGEAARKASPVLLEPMMAVDVTVPEEFMGMTIGDINSRRGRIEGIQHAAGPPLIRAIVPLAEMLTSCAHGRPKYSMHFVGYQPVPARHGPFGDDAAAYAKKPWRPKPGAGSAAAELED